MRIFYTADLHGDTNFYREVVKICREERIDIVILGGDLFPRIGHSNNSISNQINFCRNYFRDFLGRLKKEIVSEIFSIFGNNDWAASLDSFGKLEKEGLIHLLHNQKFEIEDNLLITGYPFVPPTNFSPKDFEKRDRKDDVSERNSSVPVISDNGSIKIINEKKFLQDRSSIEDDMASIIKPLPGQNMIYIMHSPPHNTMLDRLYNSQPVGSRAIRKFIEDEQPFLTLHGHIHESPAVSGVYREMIGNTLSVNPGQVGGFLSGIIFESDNPEESMYHIRYDKGRNF